MSVVVHAAPHGVTKEWFNTVEHPSFPCGAVTEMGATWRPRLWQVTCEECRKAVAAQQLDALKNVDQTHLYDAWCNQGSPEAGYTRGPVTITPGPVTVGPATRCYPEDIRALGRTFGPPRAPRGVWSGG
jgi:hypothetical protein